MTVSMSTSTAALATARTAGNTPAYYYPTGDAPVSDGRYALPSVLRCAMSEKVLAPASFFVSDRVTKQTLFEVKRKPFSFEAQKSLLDPAGDKLFVMHVDPTSLLTNTFLTDLRTGIRFLVRKKGFLPSRGRGTLQMFLDGQQNTGPVVEVVSNASRTNATVVDCASGRVLASVSRKGLTPKRFFTGLDSYTFDVQPGVDIPLVVMLAVCYDEQYTE